MRCYLCHQSPWMQAKSMTFLKNLLENYDGRIVDEEVFQLLDCEGADTLLASLVRENFSADIIERMSQTRERGFLLELDSDPVCITLKGLWNKVEVRRHVRAILSGLFEHALQASWGKDTADDSFKMKMQEFQTTLKLTDEEVDIFLCMLALNENIIQPPVRNYQVCNRLSLLSKCLNTPEVSILGNMTLQSSLRRFQCLDEDLDVNSNLYNFLNGMSKEPLANSYFIKDTAETLPWSDFGEVSAYHGSILKRMLTSSDKPVNILLYGAPGTGKTSFARALAHEIGKTCYSIAQNTNGVGDKVCSSPESRFGALQVCDGQIVPEESLIVVDEADAMLHGNGGFGRGFMMFGGSASCQSGDKGMLNTVLDTMKTSTIWITNSPAEALDESSRRRFDYSICFAPLDCEQRKRIWQNNLARLNMGRLIGKRQIEEYASKYPVSAGGISQMLANLEKMHPKKSEVPYLVEQLMQPHCVLMGIAPPDDKLLPSKDYSLEGLNIRGDVQLERIVEAVRDYMGQKGRHDPDRPRMNLLLSGAPGTGKTEFVKYLGSILKTKVNVCMGSDLLDKYVGGTEKNIANAFRQAEAERAILFLDEIDGLIQSRTNAMRSWEVTQVNELLHQMENFNGIMIGATNFVQNLDQAIMRRFTFKLQFDYLDDDGKRIFFQRMFHASLTEEERQSLYAIPNLAPGDFRTVRQSLFYYGGNITNCQRLEALQREAEAKACNAFVPKGKIGF